MELSGEHHGGLRARLLRVLDAETVRALRKAAASPSNRLLIGVALLPLVLALAIPMLNVHIIYPAFTDIIVQSIEEDAGKLARHEIPASLKHTKLTHSTLTDRFFGQIYRLELHFGLYKVRVYSPEGEILYSTDPAELGSMNTSEHFRESVAQGQSVTTLVKTDTRDLDGNIVSIDVVETYVPIMKDGTFLGAFEMYYDISKRTARLDQLTWYSRVAMITLSVTLFLSVLLLLKSVAARQIAQDKAEALKSDVDRITRHDLKTPLIALTNGIAYLESFTELDDEQKSMTEDMRAAAAKAMEIVNRSLDLYKMEQGTYEFAPATMDLLVVLRRVQADLLRTAMAYHSEIRILLDGTEVTDSDSAMIESEEGLWYSLLANLIKNGIEASEQGDVITATITMGDRVRLDIHNPAPVPESIRDTFFDKYVTAGKSSGTGLGTYSARLLTETLGGTISMRTSEEEGTTITVELPASATNQQS